MKKTYRLTIDYMIEINEKVQADGEYSREIIEKIQHIMNAFFLVPGVLDEFIKGRFYTAFSDIGDPWGNDLGELLEIKDQGEYMNTLTMHLPANTIKYFQALFCGGDKNVSSGEDTDEGMNLCTIQFRSPFPLSASFEEIKDANGINHEERVNFPGLENCKLVQSIIQFLQQGVKCA